MSKERRRFYRIEDDVAIKFSLVEPDLVDDKLDSFWNDRHQYSIRNDFNFKIEQHQADLNKIKKKTPELGRYLTILQEQIDLLNNRLLGDDDDFTDSEKRANLSAQGISFYSDQAIDKTSIVEFHLRLLPSRLQVISYARVINCEKEDHEQGEYRISLDFEHIHEADQEILVKHIHAKQLKELNASRLDESADTD